jgi:hypothetical protein
VSELAPEPDLVKDMATNAWGGVYASQLPLVALAMAIEHHDMPVTNHAPAVATFLLEQLKRVGYEVRAIA